MNEQNTAPKTFKKILLLTIFLILALAAWQSGLFQYLNLDVIKNQQATWRQSFAESPWLIGIIFFLIYVLFTAISFPGATLLTLLAGAIFGFWRGMLIVSFASSLGALLAFLAARYLMKDWLQEKYGDRLQKINAGFAKEGGFYLFALRLLPLFPFFLVNLLSGLLPMKAKRFYWISQLGMIPGTAAYVYGGLQLGKIDKLSDILSPGLISAFIILGLLPLITAKLLNWLRTKPADTST